MLEPHLDALAILGQAGEEAAPGTWGVFAAEGPGEPLRATTGGSAYVLDGRKHWCSLGGGSTTRWSAPGSASSDSSSPSTSTTRT